MTRVFTRNSMKLGIVIILLTAFVLTLSGCFLFEEPPPEETPVETAPEETPEHFAPSTAIPIVNDKFTLRYNPSASLNPITCSDSDNLLVTELMYEGLFALDNSFNIEYILCESFTTDDFQTYTFTLKQGIFMSDGQLLTAGDAAYSIGRACGTGRFVNRLRQVQSIDVIDDTSFSITLDSPNSRFTKLLDIPIIKYGGIDERIPVGTGPYVFDYGSESSLVRFSGYRDYDSLPVSAVYLRECTREELIELFSDGEISMLKDDPGGASDFYISRQHETRYYSTTALQFLGFNSRNAALRDPLLRRAISIAVDRTYIAETIMPGSSVVSPLVLPPEYELYDYRWEPYIDSINEISSILSQIGLADENSDSFLEYPDPNGGFSDFAIDFIVNNDNAYKTEAADRIAAALRRVGFNITVRKLSWNGFIDALESGDFDMYYGETVLSADYNLAPLLAPGGALDYGNIGQELYADLINAFLSAPAQDAEREAAHELCAEIERSAPIIPVLYKKHAMHSVRGVVANASPSQSSVFYKLTDWIIRPGGINAR